MHYAAPAERRRHGQPQVESDFLPRLITQTLHGPFDRLGRVGLMHPTGTFPNASRLTSSIRTAGYLEPASASSFASGASRSRTAERAAHADSLSKFTASKGSATRPGKPLSMLPLVLRVTESRAMSLPPAHARCQGPPQSSAGALHTCACTFIRHELRPLQVPDSGFGPFGGFVQTSPSVVMTPCRHRRRTLRVRGGRRRPRAVIPGEGGKVHRPGPLSGRQCW